MPFNIVFTTLTFVQFHDYQISFLSSASIRCIFHYELLFQVWSSKSFQVYLGTNYILTHNHFFPHNHLPHTMTPTREG